MNPIYSKMPSAFCGLLQLLLISLVVDAAQARQPNVLVIIADQWRAQATGYAGDPNVKTPNLDRMAGESVNFVNAVSGCPVCSPFRASFVTGQRPLTHGIFLNDLHLRDDVPSLGKALASGGYDTAWIGKWHLQGGSRSAFIPPGDRQGFAYWKVLECTHEYNRSFYYADGPEKLKWPGYDATSQTADAQQYIRDHAKSGKPFVLVLAWGPPHNPYDSAPQEFRKLYDPAALKLRANVPADVAQSTRKDLAGYYAHCSALDACIGELWKSLRENGIEEETIIVFTADHGDMLGSHGEVRKQRPYDESIRVPMLWHFPAKLGRAPHRIETPINSEDLMPTLLSFCGIAIPKGVEGLDFATFLLGGKNPNTDDAALITSVAPFGEWTASHGGREYRGLRTARYTYVRVLTGPWLLFDNQQDPDQMRNLVNDPDAAKIQAELDDLLKRRLAANGDEFRPGTEYISKWGYITDATGTIRVKP